MFQSQPQQQQPFGFRKAGSYDQVQPNPVSLNPYDAWMAFLSFQQQQQQQQQQQFTSNNNNNRYNNA